MPHSKCMNVKTQLDCPLPTTRTIALRQHGTLLSASTYTVGMRCHWWMAKECQRFFHGIIACHAALGSKTHSMWASGTHWLRNSSLGNYGPYIYIYVYIYIYIHMGCNMTANGMFAGRNNGKTWKRNQRCGRNTHVQLFNHRTHFVHIVQAWYYVCNTINIYICI